MYRASLLTVLTAAGFLIAPAAITRAQVNPPAPSVTNAPVTPTPAPVPGASASPSPLPFPTPIVAPGATATPVPTPTPTQPPIIVQPASAQVAVGYAQTLHVNSVLGTITATPADPKIVAARIDQAGQNVVLTGVAPGATTVTISDQRGLQTTVPVRVAYNAGSIADSATVRITGDPASSDFVREIVVEIARAAAQVRPGAQLIATTDQVSYTGQLAQDNIATIDVPVLIQGGEYFTVEGTTHVRIENMAAPKITPDSLMVSDYPETLTENGVLFESDLRAEQPSRFLYFHYNPPGQPDRRIVLRAVNASREPAVVQFISGAGGPGPNEMEVGHTSTKRFLVRLIQNEGRIIVIPGNGTLNLFEQELPARSIVSNMLQLRVLSGSTVHLTLFAQNASQPPDVSLSANSLLSGDRPHARGIYAIPEFHYSTLWNTTDPYLTLSVGQIPLPNLIKGELLSGDYGVMQTFVIKVQNPTGRPQSIAIYQSPRGGRATGTYLIDGILIQSHGTPAFSRYKVRQYVVPAKGFVRVTVATIPDSGSSLPLQLIFAPDDGSVAPGAPGSPVY
ncbi:MAG: pilus assembly protein N-terminal domain-containing protein [Vulcanimicrobiaceae bacterium]